MTRRESRPCQQWRRHAPGLYQKKYRQKVCVVVSRCCCSRQQQQPQQQQSLATKKRVKGTEAGNPNTHTSLF